MGDRFLLWLGAGAVCAGVTVGMLAGAGTAFAQTDSDGGDGAATTSQSAKTADNEQGSSTADTPKRPDPKPAFARDVVKAIDAVNDAVTKVVKTAGDSTRSTVTEPNVRTTIRPEPGRRAANLVNDVVAAVTHKPDRKAVIEKTGQTNPVEEPDQIETVDPVEVAPDLTTDAVKATPAVVPDNPGRAVERITKAFTPTRTNLTLQAPSIMQPTVASAAAPQPKIDVPPAISALGTAVFGLISFAESIFEGPPLALPGSGVTVKRSTLTIGDQEVPADWYFPDTYDPDSDTPPERIIYLQHGFGARGVFYDYTASYLANQTNSIVVAPSVTSNLFATDGMWLGGDPMHYAMADLFNDDNAALLESAKAAGYTQNQLPQQVVLVGHSLGGGAVLNTARYMAANQKSGESTHYDLAGVVMLDGVSFTDPAEHIALIPDDIPVYNLSSTPNPWNLFGTMDAALARERPTQFHGAQMFLGWHSDAMVGGNPLIQLAAYAITGYGGPANVEGTQVLAAGWINDMFVCQEGGQCRASGFYGAPGTSFVVPTHFGPAIGLVAPKLDPINSFLSQATLAIFRLTSLLNFATDVDRAQAQLATAATPMVASMQTGPTLINVIGTAAWSVLDVIVKAVDVQPVLPADSSVTFGRSTLEIDCGDGYLADADWYYPKSGTPDKFIYFQHGFPARAFVYDITLQELAERNNAIVVAPSITSNYFACDGCSLTTDPMHEAVAELFEGDRAALLASARAAGFEGELPREFVIAGQSAGSMLAAGAAGYYYASAPAGEKDDLVGVLIYDGSAANGALARALEKLPPTLPVLAIAGTPAVINNFGDASQVLLEKRPHQFNGVQLVGGAHSDAFQSSAYGGLVQSFVNLTFGPSKPENVEAVQVLSQGWIADMYAGTVYGSPGPRVGIYGTAGHLVSIPTNTGTDASAYVLPGPPPAPSPIEKFFAAMLQSINANDFVTCPPRSAGSKGCSTPVAA
jgi:pimeloyl-ACP methyl ester carboxylesterase